jgi:hypothetical protein
MERELERESRDNVKGSRDGYDAAANAGKRVRRAHGKGWDVSVLLTVVRSKDKLDLVEN